MRLAIQPITRDAFAPFGELVSHHGDAMRRHLEHAHEHASPAAELRFWVSRYTEPRTLPVAYPKLERHPFSAQTFIPLVVSRYVVITAPTLPDGAPDIATLRAFLVGPGVGVCYRRATWHGPMTVLDGPAEFAVAMWSAGGPERDDEWFSLPEPLEIGTA